MKIAIAASILRLKIFCYAVLFNLQRLLVRALRTLPGCWTVLGIPRREILNVEEWVKEASGNKIYGADALAPTYRSFGSPTRIPRLNHPPPGVDGIHSHPVEPLDRKVRRGPRHHYFGSGGAADVRAGRYRGGTAD